MPRLELKPDPACPVQQLWEPTLFVNDELGVAIDDGCGVVLYKTEAGQWRPGTHIPPQAIALLSELTRYRADCRPQ